MLFQQASCCHQDIPRGKLEKTQLVRIPTPAFTWLVVLGVPQNPQAQVRFLVRLVAHWLVAGGGQVT